MIASIDIKNFRSHKHTRLKFVPGVNIIFGKPQSGKTNIFRAIDWVVNNRPLGFSFHNRKCKTGDGLTKVVLTLDNGTRIIQEKTAKNAEYKIYGPNGEKEIFSKYKAAVPDKIVELLNLSEINIQSQLDTPFLITGSYGDVAKTINQITNIEAADEWVSALTKEINNVSKEIDINEATIKDIQLSLDSLKSLDRIDELLNKADQIETKIQKLVTEYRSIHQIVTELQALDTSKFELISTVEKDLAAAEQLENDILNLTTSYNEISEVLKAYNYEIDCQQDFDELESKYKETLLEIGTCPFCQTKLNKSHIEKCLKHL